MKSKTLTVAEEWARFSKLVFRDKMPPAVQYQKMRRSFYCGFFSCFTLMTAEIGQLAEDKGDEAAAVVLDKLQNEIVEFFIEVAREQS